MPSNQVAYQEATAEVTVAQPGDVYGERFQEPLAVSDLNNRSISLVLAY